MNISYNKTLFPEVLSASTRVDGAQYLIKVSCQKLKQGYDLVTVFVSHNGLKNIKSASCSRTKPCTASKIVTRLLASL